MKYPFNLFIMLKLKNLNKFFIIRADLNFQFFFHLLALNMNKICLDIKELGILVNSHYK